MFLLALLICARHVVHAAARGHCDSGVAGHCDSGVAIDEKLFSGQSLLQVRSSEKQQGVNGAEFNTDVMGRVSDIQDLEDPDPYWITFDTKGDVDNVMPLGEAQALDAEVAALGNFPSLPPMAPLLYPELVNPSDTVAVKLKTLTRDSQIILPDGSKIPYWQTMQYAGRSMKLFITRFVNGTKGKQVFDPIPGPERVVVWEMASLLRKILVTDCAKDYITITDTKYPDALTFSKKDYRGSSFSGAIFYKHLEEDTTASYMRLGKMKSACAVANGAGITFNNIRKFSEKKTAQFVGCYAHEQSHNMGYHHKDNAPGGIQRAVAYCYRKKAYQYTTYDLTKTAGFQVE